MNPFVFTESFAQILDRVGLPTMERLRVGEEALRGGKVLEFGEHLGYVLSHGFVYQVTWEEEGNGWRRGVRKFLDNDVLLDKLMLAFTAFGLIKWEDWFGRVPEQHDLEAIFDKVARKLLEMEGAGLLPEIGQQ